MNTKAIVIILAIVVVGAIGYCMFGMQKTSPTSTATTTQEKPAGGGAAQGKININAVCEGALAYMSFPDGASAEAFVAECKEGKHPEVIEKYKADLNLGAGAEI